MHASFNLEFKFIHKRLCEPYAHVSVSVTWLQPLMFFSSHLKSYVVALLLSNSLASNVVTAFGHGASYRLDQYISRNGSVLF